MEDGLAGLIGLHAMLPVAEECVTEAESVTTHHRKMVGRSVPVAAMKLSTAMNMSVLVSLLASEVLWCIYHAFDFLQKFLQSNLISHLKISQILHPSENFHRTKNYPVSIT